MPLRNHEPPASLLSTAHSTQEPGARRAAAQPNKTRPWPLCIACARRASLGPRFPALPAAARAAGGRGLCLKFACAPLDARSVRPLPRPRSARHLSRAPEPVRRLRALFRCLPPPPIPVRRSTPLRSEFRAPGRCSVCVPPPLGPGGPPCLPPAPAPTHDPTGGTGVTRSPASPAPHPHGRRHSRARTGARASARSARVAADSDCSLKRCDLRNSYALSMDRCLQPTLLEPSTHRCAGDGAVTINARQPSVWNSATKPGVRAAQYMGHRAGMCLPAAAAATERLGMHYQGGGPGPRGGRARVRASQAALAALSQRIAAGRPN